MYTSKEIIKLSAFALFVLLSSCKKDRDGKDIKQEDLLNYRIVGTFSDELAMKHIQLFHFSKVDNEIQCTADFVNNRSVRTIKFVDNSFSMDIYGDGTVMYSFTLDRNDKDSIFIRSAAYQNSVSPAYRSWESKIYMAEEISSVKNKRYVGSDTYNINFSTDTWKFEKIPSVTGSFSELFPGAWKGRMGNLDFIGVNINKGQSFDMIFQQSGKRELVTLWED